MKYSVNQFPETTWKVDHVPNELATLEEAIRNHNVGCIGQGIRDRDRDSDSDKDEGRLKRGRPQRKELGGLHIGMKSKRKCSDI